MQILILAAGYATRLYPLTKNTPKPLLPVGGIPIIEHILGAFAGAPNIDKVIVVTNEKFHSHFQTWADGYTQASFPIEVINDHSTNDANKLGAIGDLNLVITKNNITSDLMVIAGDNLFDQSLTGFVEYAQEHKSPVLAVYDVRCFNEIKKFAAITLDDDNTVTQFEEKPSHPKTTLAGIALYYYPAHVLPMINTYISTGNNPDQPGRLVEWLYKQVPVKGWQVPGQWYDIGSHETLKEADEIFSSARLVTAGV